MKRLREQLRIPVCSTLTGLVLIAAAMSSQAAQMWTGTTGIIQNGSLVGLIWTPTNEGQCNYIEHWYLGPDYVYPNSPGEGTQIATVLRTTPTQIPFGEASEFHRFASSILPGGKRVAVFVLELEQCGGVSAP